jgi:beta-phosphoglucomutase-like phosphatase (HAD superfamily)
MQAVIFDLEGTLVDAGALSARAYGRAIAELRPDLRRQDIALLTQEPVADTLREAAANLVRRFGLREPALRHAGRVGASAPWQALLRMHLRALEDLLADPDTVLAHAHPRNVGLVREVRRSGRRTDLTTTLSWSAANRLLAALGLAARYLLRGSSPQVLHPALKAPQKAVDEEGEGVRQPSWLRPSLPTPSGYSPKSRPTGRYA